MPAQSDVLSFCVPYPISVNVYWRHRVIGKGKNARVSVYVTAEAEAYKAEVGEIVKKGLTELGYDDSVIPFNVGEKIFVAMVVYRKMVTRDTHNCQKVLFDALEGVLYPSDREIVTGFFDTNDSEKSLPRAWVHLCPADDYEAVTEAIRLTYQERFMT